MEIKKRNKTKFETERALRAAQCSYINSFHLCTKRSAAKKGIFFYRKRELSIAKRREIVREKIDRETINAALGRVF